MATVQEIHRFFVKHGQVLLAGDFSNLCYKVSETAVKRGKRQSSWMTILTKIKRISSPKTQSVANCILLERPTVNSFCKDYVEIQLQFAPLRFVVQHEN